MGSNTMSGMGSQRSTELQGRSGQPRNFLEGVRERGEFRLGLSKTVGHADLMQGDLVSVQDGRIVPLDPAFPFAGIIDQVGEQGQLGYVASVFTRRLMSVKVLGLSTHTKHGVPVFALPGKRTVFTLDEQGGVRIGEVVAVESVERERAVIGIRQSTDTRRFEALNSARR